MLNIFDRLIIRSGSPRHLPNWQSFLDSLIALSNVRRGRFIIETPANSPSMRFWRFLSSNVDDELLFTHLSDEDLYEEYIVFNLIPLSQIFDPVIAYRTFRNMFYRNVNKCPEYLISTNHKQPLLSLPLDGGWSEWKTQVPIELVYNDSTELAFHIHRGKIIQNRNAPTFGVTCINLPILLFKWKAYRSTLEYNQSKYPVDTFFHKHVLYHFHNQLIDIWLLNLLSSMMDAIDRPDRLDHICRLYQRSNIPTNLRMGVREMFQFLDLVFENKIRVSDVIDTRIFTNNRSIRDVMNKHKNELILPSLRQYHFLRFIIQEPILHILIRLFLSNLSSGENHQCMLLLNLFLDRIRYGNVMSMPGNSSSKKLILSKFHHLQSLLSVLKSS